MTLDAKGTATIQVQYIPFQIGEYVATLLFADENVGEFSQAVTGTSTLPLPIDTLKFAGEMSTSVTQEVSLPLRNPLLERARNAVLDRSVREKEKMGRIWGKTNGARRSLSTSRALLRTLRGPTR